MWKKLILDTLFPLSCLNCQKEGDLICQDCLGLIEVLEFIYCPFCKIPKRVFEKGVCPNHRKMNLKGLFAGTSYKDPLVKKLIGKFKYEPFLKTLSLPLAYLIITHFLLTRNQIIFKDKENSVFLPIPLSKKRERWRGFNQANLLAEVLSKYYGVSLQINNLIKIKETQPQVELKKEEREKNIKDAFKIVSSQEIQGKKVFLVDDVFTSGTTMEEAARVLKTAGAQEVWGVVIAREIFE
ncbi:MAG: phosphoribosyltransferase family protein [Patescibacteria group bacterium]|nr:phosphoribosyltransferase family protein [Patescibacteria group bacterium]